MRKEPWGSGIPHILLALFIVLPLLFTTVVYAYSPMTDQNVFRSHQNNDKKIALTFDDGPHRTKTAEILDILKEYEVPATFFVIGENAKAHPELIQRELEEGHEIGNHTFTHCHLRQTDEAQLREEIRNCQAQLQAIAGYTPKLFRPPEGVCSEMISAMASDMHYRIILWCIDTEDWRMNSAQAIEKEVLSKIEPGSIVLFHDGIAGNTHTAEALRYLLPRLQEEGYTPVTVSELLCS